MPKAKKKVKITKGDKHKYGVCGLVVQVEEACGRVDVCDIVCCDKPMKKQRKTK